MSDYIDNLDSELLSVSLDTEMLDAKSKKLEKELKQYTTDTQELLLDIVESAIESTEADAVMRRNRNANEIINRNLELLKNKILESEKDMGIDDLFIEMIKQMNGVLSYREHRSIRI